MHYGERRHVKYCRLTSADRPLLPGFIDSDYCEIYIKEMMRQIFSIAIGGALGALARYGVATLAYAISGGTFPIGTLVINLSGSFLIGFFYGLFDAVMISSVWRSLIAIGFLGAFTTFSTFTLETINLLRESEWRLAIINVLVSNLAGLLLVLLGLYVSKLTIRMIS